ncbi:hypothetical protein [Sphingobacterium hungaricum]
MKSIIKLCIGILVFTSCTKDSEEINSKENFTARYGGKPFVGTAKGARSQDGVTNYTWNGEGRIALIEALGDSVSMVFMADFGDKGEINFKVRGKFDESTYRMETSDPTIYFRILEEQITGSIKNAGQQMLFQGSMQQEQVKMTMQVDFMEENGPFPKGSSLNLSFDTNREVSENDGDGSGCGTRLVPIWSPSGVTMGLVPDC